MGARLRYAMVTLVTLAVLAACSSTGEAPEPTRTAPDQIGTPAAAATVAPGSTGEVALGDRPFLLHVPAGYDPARPVPLVVGLHGYTSTSSELASYFGLVAASDERGFLLALPDGLTNPAGDQYWNAVEHGCCDFYGADTDDSGYLSSLVDAVSAAYTVDTVAVVGHSNGGYMANRFACDHADQVDAFASLAGPLAADTEVCRASEPVRVLHVHGDADDVVLYGGAPAQQAASAEATVQRWAQLDGCSAAPEALGTADLEAAIAGEETDRQGFGDCAEGGGVELWTIHGGGHVPELTDDFTPLVLDFLLGT